MLVMVHVQMVTVTILSPRKMILSKNKKRRRIRRSRLKKLRGGKRKRRLRESRSRRRKNVTRSNSKIRRFMIRYGRRRC